MIDDGLTYEMINNVIKDTNQDQNDNEASKSEDSEILWMGEDEVIEGDDEDDIYDGEDIPSDSRDLKLNGIGQFLAGNIRKTNDEFRKIVEYLNPKNSGKRVCETRKQIRKNFADKNRISYKTEECSYEGKCSGTCPKCDKDSIDILSDVYPIVKERKARAQRGEFNNNITGDIYRISRTRMGTDGGGIGTLVVFDHCPLKCKYCLNDSCHDNKKAVSKYTPLELADLLDKDALYFLETGGAVIFGGGEPLLQSEYIHEVCKAIDLPYQKRIETSLNVSWENVERLIDDIDLWIVDIKDMNPDIYYEYTEWPANHMKHNLGKLIAHVGKERVHIRVPHIANYNTDEDVKKSISLIKNLYDIDAEEFEYNILTDVPKKSEIKRMQGLAGIPQPWDIYKWLGPESLAKNMIRFKELSDDGTISDEFYAGNISVRMVEKCMRFYARLYLFAVDYARSENISVDNETLDNILFDAIYDKDLIAEPLDAYWWNTRAKVRSEIDKFK